MSKNNIRSFRFSDEVKEILESQDGDSLNEKFENLVFLCFRTKEKIVFDIEILEKQKSQLQSDISDCRDKLREMNGYHSLLMRLDNTLHNYVDSLESYVTQK